MTQRQYALSLPELAEIVLTYLQKREKLLGKVTRCEMNQHVLADQSRVYIVNLDVEEPTSDPPSFFPLL